MKLQEIFDPTEEADSEDVGSVSAKLGFKVKKEFLNSFGEERPVTLLKKNDLVGDVQIIVRYVINPKTGAWKFQAALPEHQFVDFEDGEDSNSLIDDLKKERKLTPDQIINFLAAAPKL